MKTLKKIISVLMVVIMLALPMTVISFADGSNYGMYMHYTYGDFVYIDYNGKAYITQYTNSSAKSIAIPKQINGLTVERITGGAFYAKDNLTSVTIPDSVNYIESSAFFGCTKLTSITIPNSVKTIESSVFKDCTSLTSITIGNGVTEICSGAFENTGYYNNSKNWDNNVLYIGNYLIDAKTSISGSYRIKDGTKLIANSAFSGCTGMTSVTIPNSVTIIGYGAFGSCSGLTSIKIGSGVKEIGEYVFDYCKGLTKIEVDPSNSNYSSDERGVLFNKNKTTLIQYPVGNTSASYNIPSTVKNIGNGAFENCISLTSVTIPNGVTYIGVSAFRDCSNLTKITIPSSVTIIDNDAFCNCDKLTSITIPDSVTRIGSWAFESCDKLANVVIGSGVKEIEMSAFGSCNNLTTVTIKNGVEIIGERAFAHCERLDNIIIPGSVKVIERSAFWGCINLDNITISDEVKDIDSSAFSDTGYSDDLSNWDNGVLYIGKHLIEAEDINGSYSIKSGTKTIAAWAFAYCEDLTGLSIPNSVTNIGYRAFSDCTGLTSVTIPNSVTSIGDEAFDGCEGLTKVNISSVESWCKISFSGYNSNPLSYANKLYLNNKLVTVLTIPNSVTSIGDYTFESCTSLTSVTIPNSVTSIGDYAFSDCTGMTSITIPNGVTNIGSCAFSGCTGLSSVTIPNSVTSIGDSVFAYCTGLKSITIPNSVTSIGYGAFSGCTGLKSVTIPNGVTSIKYHAFGDCTGMTSITIPNSVTSIGMKVFEGCTGLKDIYFTGTEAQWKNINIDDYNDEITKATIHFSGHTHSYTSKVTKNPTCTATGVKTFTCSCGATYTETIAATGHSFGEWTITKQPTASAEGVKTRTCKTCGYKETQSIPKTSSDIIEENVSMNYKQSADLSDLLAYDGCVIESSNPSVVRINGKRMEAVGTGSANVVISQYGETVAVLHINVGYSFFQWLILIFLFGWIWY